MSVMLIPEVVAVVVDIVQVEVLVDMVMVVEDVVTEAPASGQFGASIR